MYVTRRLSVYQKDPSALSLPPPDGPDTGVLVIQDEKEPKKECCFPLNGYSLDYITDLPFPQNTRLGAVRNITAPYHIFQKEFWHLMVIPVINKPLSTGLYYILDPEGGAYTANGAKGEFKACLCFKRIRQFRQRPLDPSDIYQQFYIKKGRTLYQFKSFGPDGHIPRIFYSTESIYIPPCAYKYQLEDVSGLDHSLRECLPNFSFPLSHETSDAVIIGKWYCPFMFVKEQSISSLDTQMKISMFYEVTLKQQWVRIFSCSRNYSKNVITGDGDSVAVDVDVETEVVDVVGMKNCKNVKVIDGVIWFEGLDKDGRAAASVGLNRVIVDKIIRDQESFGWVRGKVKVKRVEKFEGKGSEWKNFGCYVLVEKYVLRRGEEDKKLVLIYEFWHTQHIRCKWENE